MVYQLLTGLMVMVHLGFVLFVVFGALLVLRRPRLAWIHVPAAIWGVAIEFGGWICPLTPLENRFHRLADLEGYEGGFVDHYLLPVLYPGGLNRQSQIVLGLIVLAINLTAYGVLVARRLRARRAAAIGEDRPVD